MSRAIALHNSLGETNVQERIIHTGQHYDDAMSAVFFDQLKIPKPWRNLEVGSGPHGKQTGLMMERLEEVLTDDRPDLLLNYGDTNSTLASALVAAKMHIPVAHVEAGLRSFNRKMPEEINRIMTDHISTWLFCPSIKSQEQLASEGIHNGVHVAGDVMYDALLFNLELAKKQSQVLDELSLQPGAYHLATVHRAENTDAADKLSGIFKALGDLGQTVVLPLHPRTENCLTRHKLNVPPNVRTIPPASYLDMLQLISGARIVFTDSGGLQKEAFWLDKALRDVARGNRMDGVG